MQEKQTTNSGRKWMDGWKNKQCFKRMNLMEPWKH